MKIRFMFLSLFFYLITWNSTFARVDFESVPLDQTWAITCNMVDEFGKGTTDYVVTTNFRGPRPLLFLAFSDSKGGDNHATFEIRKVETAEGGGNNLLSFDGKLITARGEMFQNPDLELAVVIDLFDQVTGVPNTFKSKIVVLNSGEELNYPLWAQERHLQCELVPQ